MAHSYYHYIFLLTILTLWRCSEAQFPRVCAQNITDKTGVCCPDWLQAGGMVCGGIQRGLCLPLDDVSEKEYPVKPEHIHDDRLNWPKEFFTNVCHCFGNRAGYACHECKFGYYGPDCTQRRIQKRHNILSLTKAEQQRFIQLVLKSKVTLSDFVALKSDHQDPVKGNIRFVNMTVHDMFVYIHYYSARSTHLHNSTHFDQCDLSPSHYDFSHEGSAFPTFHRLLMLLWEREYQKLAGDDTFMFPYWDWVENGHNCEVCTNDLLGAINYSDPNGYLDRRSPFYHWYTMCETVNGSMCRFCDPEARFPGITRRPVPQYRFPTLQEVDLILSFPQYDRPPYDENAGQGIFRACFEGLCPMPGQSYSIHNLVHAWFNGSLSGVMTSTNDPLFMVHHSMIDKLFERWLRMHKVHANQMPEFGAPRGHHRDSVVAPMFPRFFHHMFFTDSRSLGYDYDNFDYGKQRRRHPDTYLELEEDGHSLLVLGLSIPVLFTTFIVFSLVRERLRVIRSGEYAKYKTVKRDQTTSNGHSKGYGPVLESDSELNISDEEVKALVDDNDYCDTKKNIY